MQPTITTTEVDTSTDPMDTTTPTSASMAPPQNSSPEMEHGPTLTNGSSETTGPSAAPAAVAAAHGPKVVQTAFIHKLYNMLEDSTIQHLISWSNSNESFVMSPSSEFSKVLAQYFKHTNVSSFVRQLNMYGFHKVADVFHQGSPDSTLWEFKHGNGNFKKGDLNGLREIKRRASRHALIHRESFSGHKAILNQPGTPAEPVQETLDQRMANLERTVYHLNQRTVRADDHISLLSMKCQTLTEGLVRCHQWSHHLSSHMQSTVSPESSIFADCKFFNGLGFPTDEAVANMQKEIARHLELVRSLENSHETLLARQPYFGSMSLDPNPPGSPRQAAYDESRRSSVQMLEPPPAVPLGLGYVGRSANLPTSPRSYGATNSSPNSTFNRPPVPTHRPSVAASLYEKEPNLARRHTSADIRSQGWPPSLPPIPAIPQNHTNSSATPAYMTNPPPPSWPSSPHRPPAHSEQNLRDHLASYEINPRRPSRTNTTPPPNADAPDLPWSSTAATAPTPSKYPRFSASLAAGLNMDSLHSAPATRRSSMASNVHSLLNPAETAEIEGEDEGMGMGGGEERKRKRLG